MSADLEVDGTLPLAAAHEIASRLEEAIRDELGPDVEVETHIEPLPAAVLAGRDAAAARVAEIGASALALAADFAGLDEVHDVRVRETADGEIVNFHCRVDPALSVSAVHDLVDAHRARPAPALSRHHARHRPRGTGAPSENPSEKGSAQVFQFRRVKLLHQADHAHRRTASRSA